MANEKRRLSEKQSSYNNLMSPIIYPSSLQP